MADFELTARQAEAQEILNGVAQHILLAGGSRSGKTFLVVRKIVQRALKAPGSRHGIFRFRLGHCIQSIVRETFPAVMRLAFPGITYALNQQDWFATLPGGSEIWFSGLDDKDRVEKVLGKEYVSLFLNECSQIPWNSRNIVVTRLAQKVLDRATGRDLVPKMYYDCNPPDKGHWTYKLFKLHQDPETKQPVDALDYAFFQINPRDNTANLTPAYIKTLEGLAPRLRKRFLDGEFRDANPNALFQEDLIERWRQLEDVPEMLRIVVPVDPSGADDDEGQGEHDDIGIVPCGLGLDGNGYVLEDLTCNVGPATWGKVTTDAFDRLQADCVVGEVNFGGAMVGHVIQTARPRTPFRKLTASRGKVVRAEPVAALMETGKIRLAGHFPQLEEELAGFTTHGYVGEHSPNRADAMIWGMSCLFPELTKPEKTPQMRPAVRIGRPGTAWMGNL